MEFRQPSAHNLKRQWWRRVDNKRVAELNSYEYESTVMSYSDQGNDCEPK